jgi:hypothetical protein
MGVLGDTFKEFKQAKTSEKIFIVGGGVAAIAIALYIHNQSQGASGSTSTAQPSTASGGTSSGGIQTVPGPNSSTLPILPSGLQTVTDAQGNVIAYQPSPPPVPNVISSGNFSGTIRARGSNPSYATYDRVTPGGIPIRATPGGKQTGVVPYGSTVSFLSPPQSGGINSKGGSAVWYPTANGFISSQDIGGITNVPQGGGPYGTRVLDVNGSRMAPVHEGRRQYTHVTRIMSGRTRSQ